MTKFFISEFKFNALKQNTHFTHFSRKKLTNVINIFQQLGLVSSFHISSNYYFVRIFYVYGKLSFLTIKTFFKKTQRFVLRNHALNYIAKNSKCFLVLQTSKGLFLCTQSKYRTFNTGGKILFTLYG